MATKVRRFAIRAVAVGLMSAVAVLGPSAAQAAVGDSVYGNHTRSSLEPGICIRSGYNVQTTSSGTSGTFTQTRYRCDGSGYTGDYVTVDVTCLVISGSQATLGGRITARAGAFYSGFTSIQERVVDNTTPSSPTNPDRAITVRHGGAVTCVPFNFSTIPITQGDIEIRRAS